LARIAVSGLFLDAELLRQGAVEEDAKYAAARLLPPEVPMRCGMAPRRGRSAALRIADLMRTGASTLTPPAVGCRRRASCGAGYRLTLAGGSDCSGS
jgi:hypothetical protein